MDASSLPAARRLAVRPVIARMRALASLAWALVLVPAAMHVSAAPLPATTTGVGAPAADASAQTTDDPGSFVQFTHEDDSNCQLRDGKKIFVHSTHPTRRIRVWLDRYYQNVGTGDRGRSDLAPAAEAEPLGCDTVMNGAQEWRIARALFLD